MSYSSDPAFIQDAGVLVSVFLNRPATGYVILNWVWEGTDPDSYTIEGSDDNVTWATVSAATGDAESAIVGGLDLTQGYYFRIVADVSGTPDTSGVVALNWPAIAGPDTLFLKLGETPGASYYITNDYEEGTATWSLSGVAGSFSFMPVGAGVILVGAPTEEGHYEATLRVTSTVDGTVVQAVKPVNIYVTGPNYVGAFHQDTSRTGIIVDATTGAVGQFPTGALDLGLGDAFDLHVLLRQGVDAFVGSGVTNLRLVVKLVNQRDTPPLLNIFAATPTMDTLDAVDAWRLAVAVAGPLLERLFDGLNASPLAVTSSPFLTGEGQVQWTAGGRNRASAIFPVKIRQPLVLR